ncbi:hypothetical protein EDC94DRAFT_579538 [Helicostylum pulchrum]|nr:hypothetical protein EDC94DRAFT_579538 [Helicostylum pulchrum]
MSSHSKDYKYLKYTINNASVNHPSFDRDLDSSFSSFESIQAPSRTKSATAIKNNYGESSKAKSFISEPVLKKSRVPLTQETLTMHNSFISSHMSFDFDLKQPEIEQSLFDRVDEQCKTMKQEFDEKISKLEEQFAKAEEEYNQSRFDIEELHSMEKEYLAQGVQTELSNQDILNGKELQDFANETKKIIWDTHFIPIESICRQLPTKQDNDDVCEYHRKRIEKLELAAAKEKKLHSNDNDATLNMISKWSKTIYHH